MANAEKTIMSLMDKHYFFENELSPDKRGKVMHLIAYAVTCIKKGKKAEGFATRESTDYVIKIGDRRYSRSDPDRIDWYPSRYLWVAFAELLIAAERGDGDTSSVVKRLAEAAAAADSREYQSRVPNSARYGVWDRVRGHYRNALKNREREYKYLFGLPDKYD